MRKAMFAVVALICFGRTLQAQAADSEDCRAEIRRTIVQSYDSEQLLQLLRENQESLSARDMFIFRDLAQALAKPSLVMTLNSALLAGLGERPEELAGAYHEASEREDWGMIFGIWNHAPQASRTPELNAWFIERACKQEATSIIKMLTRASPQYEQIPTLSEGAKRFATAYIKGPELAQSLVSSFFAGLNGDALFIAEPLRIDFELGLSGFFIALFQDEENPFFLQEQAAVLGQELAGKLAKEDIRFELEDIEAASWAWINRYKKAGVPPIMRTRH